jgi:hypothetical protein
MEDSPVPGLRVCEFYSEARINWITGNLEPALRQSRWKIRCLRRVGHFDDLNGQCSKVGDLLAD